jgi:hypothetical protein
MADADQEKSVVTCGRRRANGQECANVSMRSGMCLQWIPSSCFWHHQRSIYLTTAQSETPCRVYDNVSVIGASVGAKRDNCWRDNR